MIPFNQLVALDRPIFFFDLETTGPVPGFDRIVSLGFDEVRPDGSQRKWATLVNPGIPIPHEATYGNLEKDFEGHGITNEMVQGCRVCGFKSGDTDSHIGLGDWAHEFKPWPAFRDLAPSLQRGFTACDFGGYNVKTFDLPLLREEFKRVGITWSYEDARIIDGYRLWQIGQARNLTAAVRTFLRREPSGAHGAATDAADAHEVVTEQLQIFDTLPRNVAALHELQWPRDPNALDPEGKIIWREGVAVVNFGKNWRGKRLDLMTRKDLDWIANKATDMNATVRKICADALAGNFPVKET